MKPLNAKDIEKLENTSIASAMMAASVASAEDLINNGATIDGCICLVGSGCVVDSCDQSGCEEDSCDNTGCENTQCEETVDCGLTCIDTACGDSGAIPTGAELTSSGFSALLRAALK